MVTKAELVEAQVEAARRIASERQPRETARALLVVCVVIPLAVVGIAAAYMAAIWMAS